MERASFPEGVFLKNVALKNGERLKNFSVDVRISMREKIQKYK